MANYATSALKLSDTYVNTLPYNVCSTAAEEQAKIVDAGSFSLETGAMVVVKFTYTNSAASPTLNVSSTGAKAIYYKGAAITASYLAANKVFQFIYDGTQWNLVGDINTDANTKNTAGTTNKTGTKLYLAGATSQAASPQTYSNSNVYIGTDNCLYSNGSKVLTSYTDTKNTTGSTDTSSKIFLVGATSQAANPQTYSHDTVYVGTDGHLYDTDKQVATTDMIPTVSYPVSSVNNSTGHVYVPSCYSGSTATVSSGVHTLTINEVLSSSTTMIVTVTAEFASAFTSGNTIKVTGKYKSGNTTQQTFTTAAVALKDLKGNAAPTNAFTAGSLNQIMLKLTRSGTTVTIAKAYINSAVATWN